VTRRGTVNRKPAKTHRRKTTRPKRGNAPTAARQRGPSVVDLQEQLDARTRQLNEAIERENATAEVLRVISSSPGELAPVFEAMLANAVRLCEAKFGMLFLHERGALRIVATHNVPPEVREARRSFRPHPDGTLGKVLRTKRTVHVDLASTRAYAERHPATVEAVELGGIRTNVGVPMLKDEEVVGVIVVHRKEVRPFADKQVALLGNFAAQAVIAIENTRLLNELRQRTGDLSDSLEQQTASAEALQVIASSRGELEPVFATILTNATRLCGANFGNLYLCDGETFHIVAGHNTPPVLFEWRKRPFRPGPKTTFGRMVSTRSAIQVADLRSEQSYIERDPQVVTGVELGGIRTLVGVPMLKEEKLIGALAVFRQEVRPFTNKQIALVASFSNQAVIAIENARLLNELRESLQQQTATTEVLRAISRSFESSVQHLGRVCHPSLPERYRLYLAA
jgi:GAF domain-containing protein